MNRWHRYSKEQEDFLIRNIEGVHYKDLAVTFNQKFNANVSESAVRQKCRALGVQNNIDPRFQKGILPPTTLPVGAESTDEDGNPIIKIGQPRKWKKKSHIVWEEQHGPVPKNHYVIFLNQNKKDCRVENLALVSRSTFSKLVHSGLYTEDADLTRVGITMALLKQKIDEHEKAEEKELSAADFKKKIKFLEEENARLEAELKRSRYISQCFYEWGTNHRDGLYG